MSFLAKLGNSEKWHELMLACTEAASGRHGIECRLDARTFRMLQDIEQHVRIDFRRAPRSASVPSAIRMLYPARWPNGMGE